MRRFRNNKYVDISKFIYNFSKFSVTVQEVSPYTYTESLKVTYIMTVNVHTQAKKKRITIYRSMPTTPIRHRPPP